MNRNRTTARNSTDRGHGCARRTLRERRDRPFFGWAEPLEQRTLFSTVIVNTLLDVVNPSDGKTSLREAIVAAAPGDTVAFASSLTAVTPGVITLGGKPLQIAKNLTIQGPGATRLAITAGGHSRVFDVVSGNVTINALTMSKGSAGTGDGGVLINRAGTLKINNATVGGGSALRGGGIANLKALTLNNTRVVGNQGNSAGGIYNAGTLTILNGTVATNTARSAGGIYNNVGATLSVTGTSFTGNTAVYVGIGKGGGVFNAGNATLYGATFTGNRSDTGGGIDSRGTLTASRCTFTENTARYGGGAIDNDATLTLTDCTLAGNTATSLGGGAIETAGALIATRCTLSGNISPNGAGGIANNTLKTVRLVACTLSGNQGWNGGGVGNLGTLTALNSTFTANFASGDGGAIYNGETYNNGPGVVTLTNCTIARNTANHRGGGIAVARMLFPSVMPMVLIRNTIVAANASNTGLGTRTADNVYGPLNATSSFNLVGPESGGLMNGVNGNKVTALNPLIGPLQSNGGATQTMALLTGSPAIDAGSNALATNAGLTTDQRGRSRIIDGNHDGITRVDIGAFEVQ